MGWKELVKKVLKVTEVVIKVTDITHHGSHGVAALNNALNSSNGWSNARLG